MGLARIANWFNQDKGILTVCRTIVGDIENPEVDINEVRETMERKLADQKIVAFPEVSIVRDFEAGVISTIQANGFAGMQSNTVMFGWTSGVEGIQKLLKLVRIASKMKRNSLLAYVPEEEKLSTHNIIDVWWRGMQKNGDMMLLLAHLLNENTEWRQAKLRLRTIVDTEADKETMSEKLKSLIEESRMSAETAVIVNENMENVNDLMHRSSSDADLVFLGMALPDKRNDIEFLTKLDKLVTGFKSTILVRNAESTQGELIE
jgi:hypothetical protein